MISLVAVASILPERGIPAWFGPLCLSPLVGSFVGVLVRRIPEGRSAAWSRSECETCKRKLAPVDLVPILSYLALRGYCRSCKSPIGIFHLIIELVCVVVALWASMVDLDPVWLWSTCILGWTLLALAWIDSEHMRLPDILTLSLLLLGIILHLPLNSGQLAESLLGACIGYAAFRAIALTYRSLRGRDGLGAGDAKLLAAAGAWVGWSALPDLVLLAVLLAILAIIVTGVGGDRRHGGQAIPFGPFLAAAFWIIQLYGPVFFELS